MTKSWEGEERRKLPLHCQSEVLIQLNDLRTEVDKIVKAIYGNGDPEKGFVVRVDRLEQFKGIMVWVVGAIGVSTIGIIAHGIAEAMGK